MILNSSLVSPDFPGIVSYAIKSLGGAQKNNIKYHITEQNKPNGRRKMTWNSSSLFEPRESFSLLTNKSLDSVDGEKK